MTADILQLVPCRAWQSTVHSMKFSVPSTDKLILFGPHRELPNRVAQALKPFECSLAEICPFRFESQAVKMPFEIPQAHGLPGVSPYAMWFHVCIWVSWTSFICCLLLEGRRMILFWATVESFVLMLWVVETRSIQLLSLDSFFLALLSRFIRSMNSSESAFTARDMVFEVFDYAWNPSTVGHNNACLCYRN